MAPAGGIAVDEGTSFDCCDSLSPVCMLSGSACDCICLRRLLTDVGEREAPNAVNRSEAFLGVLAAAGLLLPGDGLVSMNIKGCEEEQTCIFLNEKVSVN